MERYEPKTIEAKWQRVWEDAHAFEVPNPEPGAEAAAEPKNYVLEMLPYPSGSLHMGHMLVYTIGDVVTHFRRRSGARVLHPQGFDAFGLPAENAAIGEGLPPARDGGAEHREHPRVDAADRLGDRLGAARIDARARVLPLAAVAVPEVLRARPRVPEGGARQVVPERPDRARERAGPRRPL